MLLACGHLFIVQDFFFKEGKKGGDYAEIVESAISYTSLKSVFSLRGSNTFLYRLI